MGNRVAFALSTDGCAYEKVGKWVIKTQRGGMFLRKKGRDHEKSFMR